MNAKTVVLIDSNSNDLNLMEGTIKEIDPSMSCISFIFADEAVRVVSDDLKTSPEFIFIDVDANRKSGAECLVDLRKRKQLDDCRIIMFSLVMPHAVARTFKMMGANYAFQKPASRIEYKVILNEILKVSNF